MRIALIVLVLGLLSGCATTGSDPKDPLEGMNRSVYGFNDAVDRAVLKPVAQGYTKVVPSPVRTGVNNFFGNLEDLGTGLNNILQGKVTDGASDLGRFAFNTVVGIIGLWDVATPMGLEKHYEDFGQTLGWWGVPSGPYLVLPLFGPSTLRDAPARWVDPSTALYYNIEKDAVTGTLYVTDIVRSRANLLQSERVLDEAALDRYTFIRDAWLQRRRNQVHDGRPPKSAEDD